MFSIFKRSRRIRAWNKGKLMGQKPPLKLKEIWSIRIRLQMSKRRRDLALFNLALDSKLRACDPQVAEGEVQSALASVKAKSSSSRLGNCWNRRDNRCRRVILRSARAFHRTSDRVRTSGTKKYAKCPFHY